jgi:hypothetical protein
MLGPARFKYLGARGLAFLLAKPRGSLRLNSIKYQGTPSTM